MARRRRVKSETVTTPDGSEVVVPLAGVTQPDWQAALIETLQQHGGILAQLSKLGVHYETVRNTEDGKVQETVSFSLDDLRKAEDGQRR